MNIATYEQGAIALISYVIIHFAHDFSSLSKSDPKIDKMIIALGALPWNYSILRNSPISAINALLGRLKRARPQSMELSSLRAKLRNTYTDPSSDLKLYDKRWKSMIMDNALHMRAPFHSWAATLDILHHERIYTPLNLSSHSRSSILHLTQDDERKDLLALLFDTSLSLNNKRHDEDTAKTDLPHDAFQLADLISAQNLNSSQMGSHFSQLIRESDLGGKLVPKLGPTAKIRKIDSMINGASSINALAEAGARINTLKQVQFSLRAVASGLRCWGHFCACANTVHFPPSEDAVAKWSFFFPPGKTLQIYTAHLEKACQILSISCDWDSHRIRGIGKGLKNAKPNDISAKSSISPHILIKLIKHEGMQSKFAQAVLISFIFLLRVLSETLIISRATLTDDMTDATPLYQGALIDKKYYTIGPAIVIKLARRKNHHGTCILYRPCCCEEHRPGSLTHHIPNLLCPVCTPWPTIKADTKRGELLFPQLKRSNFNRILRAILTKIRADKPLSFGSHALRRGAARALLNNGGTMADLLKAGMWASSAFKVYLDMAEEEQKAVSHLLVEISDSGEE